MTVEARSGPPARYVMIGGFLGAGKTTAVAALARRLEARGVRTGLITNDQSVGLVDTTLLRSKGFQVEEIAGGCFCCRFDSLTEAAERLTRDTRPEVFVAEPVGSCTDLVATVSYPLRRIYGDRFTIAPLSVMVDPLRAARILGLREGRSFSDKVVYVYRKQLEEANLIVINKCDRIDEPLRDRLVAVFEEEFPQATVLCCSAQQGDGLDRWFDLIDAREHPEDATMDIDYREYAAGEALLGWLNCTVRVHVGAEAGEPGEEAAGTVDGNRLLVRLAEQIGRRLASDGIEIAHLKMTLDSPDGGGNLSVVSLVGSDQEVDLRESLLDRVSGGSLIVNLRAEADPERLERVTTEELAAAERPGLALELEHSEHFRPAEPVPTHRITLGGTEAVKAEAP